MADNGDVQPPGEDTAAQPESRNNSDSMAHSVIAEEPVPNLGIENLMEMDQAARDKFIQNMADLSWDDIREIRKTLPKRLIPKPANWARGDENHACPEKLAEARDGPGVDKASNVYKTLAAPRNDKDVGSPEPWSAPENPSDPSRPIADEIDNNDAVFNWSEVIIDTPEYRAWCNAQGQPQLNAYESSPRLFPIVENGKLTLTLHHDETVYYPSPVPFDDWDPQISPTEDSWVDIKISSLVIPNKDAREQFRHWWRQLPLGFHTVDICHTAFFDGTAMADGESSMIVPNLKHLPAPRDMTNEATRLHWHETAAGFIYNLGPNYQKQKREEAEMRRDAPYRAWRDRPPDSKVIPPHIYLRPAEDLDIGGVVEIMNWYARKTSLSRDIEPWTFEDYDELHEFCRKNRLPFLIAARRDHEDFNPRRIDATVGYAYVKFHRPTNDADACVGELLVFVDEDYKKDHIGRALVDMTLSCLDLSYKRSEDYEFVQSETVDVEYGPGYGRNLTKLVCAPPAEGQESWVKEWLARDFGFQKEEAIEDASNSAEYVICDQFAIGFHLQTSIHRLDRRYVARRINSPNVGFERALRRQ
jgi:L-amino acid N-acyltransferase YncA